MDALEKMMESKVSFYAMSKKRLLAYNRMIEAFDDMQGHADALDDDELEMLAAAGEATIAEQRELLETSPSEIERDELR